MKYRIWSIEHGRWWKGNESGYTNDIDKAGLYSVVQANRICIDANKFKLDEAMVPVESEGKY